MKRRAHIIVVAFLLTGVIAGLQAGAALAQQPYAQVPILYPSDQLLRTGLFYFNAGVRYRNVSKLTFWVKPVDVMHIHTYGSPAFGPNENGVVQYPLLPTGNGADNPNISGVWTYDDGFFEPTGDGYNSDPTLDPPGAAILYPSGASRGLGHFVDCAAVGSFRIYDATLQANDGGASTYSMTSGLSWSKLLTGVTSDSKKYLTDLFPAGSPAGFGPVAGAPYFDEQASLGFATLLDSNNASRSVALWIPYIEAGYRYSNFFDFFWGFSYFNIDESYSVNGPSLAGVARRGYKDSYVFTSSNTADFTYRNLYSEGFPDGEDRTQSYLIYPNGTDVQQQLPQRVFYFSRDVNSPSTAVNRTVYTNLEMQTFEFRFGGASWVPMWGGLGRVGTRFGTLWAPTPYTVTTRIVAVATEDNQQMGVTAGDVLINRSHKEEDVYWWNSGLFGGLWWELASNRFFAKTSVGWDWYFADLVYGNEVEVRCNPGGFNMVFAGGARF